MAYVVGSTLGEAVNNFKLASERIEEAKYCVDTAIVSMACTKWKGKTKDNYENLLLLTSQLHELIDKVAQDNWKVINKFYEDANEFIQTEKIIKDLE